MKECLNRNTLFCMSVSRRPSDFGIRFHNFLYDELELNFLYKSFGAASPEAFDDAIRTMKALNIRGCGISMPFKEQALKWADELTPSARRIGAINTLVNEGGRLIGHNTDTLAVRHFLDKTELPRESSVALLGSGGMARAIACALSDLGFENTRIIARNLEAGQNLAQDFGFSHSTWISEEGADLLINATPIGMAPQDQPGDPRPFTEDQTRKAQWVMESVAYPPETQWLQNARQLNRSVISGFEITLLQAVEQFELYTGKRPTPDQTRAAALFARNL